MIEGGSCSSGVTQRNLYCALTNVRIYSSIVPKKLQIFDNIGLLDVSATLVGEAASGSGDNLLLQLSFVGGKGSCRLLLVALEQVTEVLSSPRQTAPPFY